MWWFYPQVRPGGVVGFYAWPAVTAYGCACQVELQYELRTQLQCVQYLQILEWVHRVFAVLFVLDLDGLLLADFAALLTTSRKITGFLWGCFFMTSVKKQNNHCTIIIQFIKLLTLSSCSCLLYCKNYAYLLWQFSVTRLTLLHDALILVRIWKLTCIFDSLINQLLHIFYWWFFFCLIYVLAKLVNCSLVHRIVTTMQLHLCFYNQ